jgi:3-isopropylmalate/(R)-2-methylmalate dehydratase small subunit
MEPFTTLEGVAASLPQDDVDTDQILPTPWLRDPKADLAKGLFGYLRRVPADKTESDFVLEQPAFRQARILVCGSNFGCGSSREHAVWAVKAFGIRCLIAASFADIFRENCLRNGVLAIRLPAEEIEGLHRAVQSVKGGAPFVVNLEEKRIRCPDGRAIAFDISDHEREALMLGLDDIGLTERHVSDIEQWENTSRRSLPFLQDFRIAPFNTSDKPSQ